MTFVSIPPPSKTVLKHVSFLIGDYLGQLDEVVPCKASWSGSVYRLSDFFMRKNPYRPCSLSVFGGRGGTSRGWGNSAGRFEYGLGKRGLRVVWKALAAKEGRKNGRACIRIRHEGGPRRGGMATLSLTSDVSRRAKIAPTFSNS